MNAGTVDFLLILGGNPVYTAPADLEFGAALQKVALRAHVGLYEDETAELCQWHVPEAHFLEAWSDVRSDDGTVTIVQPLIAPLYGGKSRHEVLVGVDRRRRAIGLRPGARALGQSDGPFHRRCPLLPPPLRLALRRRAAAPLPLLRPPPGAAAAGAPRRRPPCRRWRRLRARRCPRSRPSIASGGAGCTTASLPDTRLRAQAGHAPGRAAAAAAAAAAAGPRGRVPARPQRLRRPLRQQRLAAGAAEVADEAHVGQRRADRARHGRAPQSRSAATWSS